MTASSRPGPLGRLWFLIKTLPLRGRFLTGKASYVGAAVRASTSGVAEVYDGRGRSLGQRLLAHHQLETEQPRTGSQGWELFVRAALSPRKRPTARPQACVTIECGYCAHRFIVAIAKAAAAQDIPTDRHGSYRSSWFSFMHRAYRGEPALSCAHCEQNSVPRVEFLWES